MHIYRFVAANSSEIANERPNFYDGRFVKDVHYLIMGINSN